MIRLSSLDNRFARSLAAALLAAALLASAGIGRAGAQDAGTTPDAEGPAAPVERLHDALGTAMTTRGFRARADLLDPTVRQSFAIDTMLRVVTGDHWPEMSAEGRADLADTFRAFMVANYASRFGGGGDGDAAFRTLETRRLDGRALVRSRLDRADREPIAFDYLVQPADDGWRIVDVYVNSGISELALRRSEFAAALRRGGAEALIADLRTIVAELEGDE